MENALNFNKLRFILVVLLSFSVFASVPEVRASEECNCGGGSAPDTIWVDRQYIGGLNTDPKFTTRTYNGHYYRGYIYFVATAYGGAYYSGKLYRSPLPYPLPH